MTTKRNGVTLDLAAVKPSSSGARQDPYAERPDDVVLDVPGCRVLHRGAVLRRFAAPASVEYWEPHYRFADDEARKLGVRMFIRGTKHHVPFRNKRTPSPAPAEALP